MIYDIPLVPHSLFTILRARCFRVLQGLVDNSDSMRTLIANVHYIVQGT